MWDEVASFLLFSCSILPMQVLVAHQIVLKETLREIFLLSSGTYQDMRDIKIAGLCSILKSMVNDLTFYLLNRILKTINIDMDFRQTVPLRQQLLQF